MLVYFFTSLVCLIIIMESNVALVLWACYGVLRFLMESGAKGGCEVRIFTHTIHVLAFVIFPLGFFYRF